MFIVYIFRTLEYIISVFFKFQLLPDLSQDTKTSRTFLLLNEAIQYFLIFSLISVILSILFLKRSKLGVRSRKHGEIANLTNISAIGIMFRYMTMMVLGHALRSLTYPLTSLPGKKTMKIFILPE